MEAEDAAHWLLMNEDRIDWEDFEEWYDEVEDEPGYEWLEEAHDEYEEMDQMRSDTKFDQRQKG